MRQTVELSLTVSIMTDNNSYGILYFSKLWRSVVPTMQLSAASRSSGQRFRMTEPYADLLLPTLTVTPSGCYLYTAQEHTLMFLFTVFEAVMPSRPAFRYHIGEYPQRKPGDLGDVACPLRSDAVTYRQ